MGKICDQLDQDERYELYRLHEAGKAPAEIGRLMGRYLHLIRRLMGVSGGGLHLRVASSLPIIGSPCPEGSLRPSFGFCL